MLHPAQDNDIETRLQQSAEFVHFRAQVVISFDATDCTDLPAVNTAEELNYIHDDSRTGRQIKEDLGQWLNNIERQLNEVLLESEQLSKAKLRAMVSDGSRFTGITRAYLRSKLATKPALLQELNLA